MAETCRFCGKEFRSITHTHLKKEHNIDSVDDYRKIVEHMGNESLLPPKEEFSDIRRVNKPFRGTRVESTTAISTQPPVRDKNNEVEEKKEEEVPDEGLLNKLVDVLDEG